MVKYREILRLTHLGISQRNIAFSCSCATSTVQAVQQAARAKHLEWPLPEEMDDAAIYRLLYPPRDRKSPDKAPIDHELIEREMGKRGVTMVLLWNEYCDKALASGKEPLMYSSFCQRHRDWASRNGVTKTIQVRTARPSYKTVKAVIARLSEDEEATPPNDHAYLRGGDYYRGLDDEAAADDDDDESEGE